MRIFTLLHCGTTAFRGVQQLASQLRGMVFSPRLRAASIIQRIAKAVRRDRTHFDRHLVGGTTDTT